MADAWHDNVDSSAQPNQKEYALLTVGDVVEDWLILLFKYLIASIQPNILWCQGGIYMRQVHDIHKYLYS